MVVLTLWRKGPPPCGRMVVPCTSTQGMRSSSAFIIHAPINSSQRRVRYFVRFRSEFPRGMCSSCFRTHLSGLRQAAEVVKPAARTACWYIVRQVPVEQRTHGGLSGRPKLELFPTRAVGAGTSTTAHMTSEGV